MTQSVEKHSEIRLSLHYCRDSLTKGLFSPPAFTLLAIFMLFTVPWCKTTSRLLGLRSFRPVLLAPLCSFTLSITLWRLLKWLVQGGKSGKHFCKWWNKTNAMQIKHPDNRMIHTFNRNQTNFLGVPAVWLCFFKVFPHFMFGYYQHCYGIASISIATINVLVTP